MALVSSTDESAPCLCLAWASAVLLPTNRLFGVLLWLETFSSDGVENAPGIEASSMICLNSGTGTFAANRDRRRWRGCEDLLAASEICGEDLQVNRGRRFRYAGTSL